MNSRDQLSREIIAGGDQTPVHDNSSKCILSRGCDPDMGRRAMEFLPPLFGNPQVVSVTNDDDFITALKRMKWSVVLFAPGACRYDAIQAPIPGSRPQTHGWGLEDYRKLVRKHQGNQIQIIETTDESEIVPRLLKALRNIT